MIVDLRRLSAVSVLCSMLTLGVRPVSSQPHSGWAAHADTLARTCVAEADGSLSDCAAILWVLEHRRERSGAPVASVIVYSATLQRLTVRTQRIHDLPVDELHPVRARQVIEARQLVDRWLDGSVSDPCPEATHWRGVGDSHPAWMRVVSCGATSNVFGREVSRGE